MNKSIIRVIKSRMIIDELKKQYPQKYNEYIKNEIPLLFWATYILKEEDGDSTYKDSNWENSNKEILDLIKKIKSEYKNIDKKVLEYIEEIENE